MLRLKIAGPTEYLAVTGQGIEDIRLTRKGWIWPWQKCIKFDLSPVNYTFEVQAMSAEKLPFILPAVFTIGPHTDDMESLYKYAKLMCNHDKTSNHVNDLVQGVIEGETRVLAAAMTMEEIFKGTKEFKEKVFEKVQLELNQFGMWIYNANVKQLVDVRGHEYFSYLGQKTQQEAANQAKIDTAEAMMKGEIGSKERAGRTAQNASKIDADTKIYSTKRVGEGKKEEIKVNTEVKIFENLKAAEVAEANAELATKKAGWAQASQMAEVESAKSVALREAELQAEVEKKNALTRTERLKADLLSKATVEYETKVQEANWDLYQKQKKTDAAFYETMKSAEAQKASADADFYVRQQAAEGELFAKMKEAEGELFAKRKDAEAIAALAQAQGIYISTLLKAFGGNYAALRDYLMIDKKMYQEIAQINASAINGLQPKISIWNNGAKGIEEGNAGAAGNGLSGIAGLYSMLPPLLQTVEEQTGMLPPAWLAKLPAASASSN